jgi:hypothetical protein
MEGSVNVTTRRPTRHRWGLAIVLLLVAGEASAQVSFFPFPLPWEAAVATVGDLPACTAAELGHVRLVVDAGELRWCDGAGTWGVLGGAGGTDTTCLDAGVDCLFAASPTEGGPASAVVEGAVTAHQAALAITESQVTDLAHFTPNADPAVDHSGYVASVDAIVATHAAIASAHHAKTIDASELTAGTLPAARLPETYCQQDGTDCPADDTGTDDQEAPEVPYTPTAPGDWTDPDPADVGDALDKVAGDPRWTDARAPTAHRDSHETGGSDPLVDLAGETITTGTVADPRLAATISRDSEAPAAGDITGSLSAGYQLGADVVGAAELGDGDLGQVAISGGVATVEGLQYGTAFPGSPATGDVFAVTDDSATGACDSAAGPATTLCRWTGAAWEALGDGVGAGGSGDVVGPASSTDNAVAVWDGTTGKLLQDSTITWDGSVFFIPNTGGLELTIGGQVSLSRNSGGDAILCGDTGSCIEVYSGGLAVKAGSGSVSLGNPGPGVPGLRASGTTLIAGLGNGTGYTTLQAAMLSLVPQASAPGSCAIGDLYVDTSGAYCACTATNTWENMTATGSCT